MKIACFDCFSGAAGDMIIGAMLDSGLSFDILKTELEKLGLSGYALRSERVTKNRIAGVKFTVDIADKQPRRHPKDIIDLISGSGLDDDLKSRSIEIFKRLAAAEAAAHGEPVEKVHFHEVGGVDAIIDICGAVIALELLGIEKVYSSPVALGTGSIETGHGPMPVPAPATAELLKNAPVRLTGIESELTTPTGAAILTSIAEFSRPENLLIESTGYGAGSRDLPGLPNLLRLFIGESRVDFDSDHITVIETNLDRVTPEMVGKLMDDLMASGALDVFVTPVVMKKNRPGQLLTVLCENQQREGLAKLIFGGGLTLGIRIRETSRIKLKRRELKVSTSAGEIAVKVGILDGSSIILPEFDDISRAMMKSGLSYDDILVQIKQSIGKER